jgi:hypothetical protein
MLRISSPKEEGLIQVSKALKVQVLLDEEEMRDLFAALGNFELFEVSRVVDANHGFVGKNTFLETYAAYAGALKEGRLPDESLFKHFFSSVMTKEREILYAMPAGEKKFLIKALRPAVQLQTHHLLFSKLDGKFHSIAQGKDTISWGLQFSYPQIAQDPKTKVFCKVANSPEFPNTALFLALSRWVRQNTLPTPILDRDRRINLPVRLGKRCFSWIEKHPRLIEKGFRIACLSKLSP